MPGSATFERSLFTLDASSSRSGCFTVGPAPEDDMRAEATEYDAPRREIRAAIETAIAAAELGLMLRSRLSLSVGTVDGST